MWRKIKNIAYFFHGLWPMRRQHAVILMYHSIDLNDQFATVSPEDFDKQLWYLQAYKFNVVSLDQLAAYRKEGTIPRKTVAITFDDGYLDNYANAFPLLQKYAMPATIFVITGALTGEGQVESVPALPMLRDEMLVEMEVSGLVSIQPHTVTHPKLTKVSEVDVLREVHDSRIYVESLLHKKCAHFAYPKGKYNEAVREIVMHNGIDNAYTVEPGVVGPETDSHLQRRNSIDSQTTFTQFKSIVRHGRLRPPFKKI